MSLAEVIIVRDQIAFRQHPSLKLEEFEHFCHTCLRAWTVSLPVYGQRAFKCPECGTPERQHLKISTRWRLGGDGKITDPSEA